MAVNPGNSSSAPGMRKPPGLQDQLRGINKQKPPKLGFNDGNMGGSIADGGKAGFGKKRPPKLGFNDGNIKGNFPGNRSRMPAPDDGAINGAIQRRISALKTKQ